MNLTLYIASSYSRNLHAVQMLRDIFRGKGYVVLDWTELAPPVTTTQTPAERLAALNTDEHGDVFTFCRDACRTADVVIYLGPSGQDAGFEIGLVNAYMQGPVFGLLGPLEAPGTMLARAMTAWFTNYASLVDAVDAYALQRSAS